MINTIRYKYFNMRGGEWSQNLDNFVVGPCNEIALKAASIFTTAYIPEYYNPLLIIGANGSGKTHLLKGIYLKLSRCYPCLKIIYTTIPLFIRDYTGALRHDNLNEFRKKYKSLDIFLIDDIQFLTGKRVLQQELEHIFDSLFLQGKKIILSSTLVPYQIKGLNPRLSSRLYSGLSVNLAPADLQTKHSILTSLALAYRLRPELALVDFITRQVNTNLRDLLEIGHRVFKRKILTLGSNRMQVEKIMLEVLGNHSDGQEGGGW